MIIKKFLVIQNTTGKKKDLRRKDRHEQAQPTPEGLHLISYTI
jgi:hypothetical protein